MKIEIKNEQVRKYYEYLNGVQNAKDIDKNERIVAKKKMNLIQDLVMIYEYGESLDYEEDLLWREVGNPLLPEDYDMLRESIRNRNMNN